MPHPGAIHIVDDDASFRDAARELLRACGYQVSVYESAQQLLKNLPGGGPACILLDVKMAGLSGPQLQVQLGELGCELPIIFVTGYGNIPTSVQTIKAGAEDFLTKPVTKNVLLEAIDRALCRCESIQERSNRLAALSTRLSCLTPKEREVFKLLAQGKQNKQIAFALGSSERTVKLHRHNVLEKLGVRSVAEIAVIADRLGLLSID